MNSLDLFADKHNQDAHSECRFRSPTTTIRTDGVLVERDGKPLISFSCNDYFGLSYEPSVVEAAQKALAKYGAGAAASRLITGNHPLYDELETLLAEVKKTDAACVFGSGYLANIGAISALMGKGDLIVVDKLSHACILDGARLSGATIKRYKHNDINDLEKIVKESRKGHNHCLIITETVFSMDGDCPDLPAIIALAKQHDCWTMTDDAHGLGLVESPPEIDIQMGTFSKAAGSYGGYVCGSRSLIKMLKSSARSLLFTTGLPPSVVAASTASLRWIQNNQKSCQNALNNAQYFTSVMRLPKAQSAIVPIVIGDDKKALEISQHLQKNGLLVSAIRPPTVPVGTARLRIAFSRLHTHQQIDTLIEALKNAL